MHNYSVIIAAAGHSKRFKSNVNKLFYVLNNSKTVIETTINIFISDSFCKQIILVYNSKKIKQLKLKYPFINFIKGGSCRQQSIYNAINLINCNYVMIHDGVRPFISNKLINNINKNLTSGFDGVIPTINISDTLISVKNNKIKNYLNRNEIRGIQTPQFFKTQVLKNSYNKAKQYNKSLKILNNFNDDSSLVLKFYTNSKIKIIDGDLSNIKITYVKDVKK